MEMESLLQEINKIHSECESCGGNKSFNSNGICAYCNTENHELAVLCHKLKETFERPQNSDVNYINSLLYSIREMGITEINEYLKGINYEEKFMRIRELILMKISNGEEINDEEKKQLFFLIRENCLGDKKSAVANYIINRVLLKTLQFPADLIKEALKLLVTETAAHFKSEFPVTCEIKDLNKDRNIGNNKIICGTAGFNSISLDESKVNEFCDFPNLEMLNTIFHEIVHIYQRIVYETRDESKFVPIHLEELKEIILKEMYGSDYYQKNYDLISYEKGANIEAYRMLTNYLQNILIDTKNLDYTEIITAEAKNLLNKNRVYNNEDYTVDELFDKAIGNVPIYLQWYPILNTIYKVVDGKVERKSIQELEESKAISLNPEFYDFYINKMKIVDDENHRIIR